MSKTIKVTLPSELAARYEQLPQTEKDKITSVIEGLLKAEAIASEKQPSKRTDNLPTFDLGGKFDNLDIRRAAYK